MLPLCPVTARLVAPAVCTVELTVRVYRYSSARAGSAAAPRTARIVSVARNDFIRILHRDVRRSADAVSRAGGLVRSGSVERGHAMSVNWTQLRQDAIPVAKQSWAEF